MFIRDLYVSAKRRWYLVLAGLLLTALMAFGVFRMAPVSYKATASVALIPPPTAVISGDNPFLYMGGLEQALGVLTVKVNSDSVREPIKSMDPASSYLAARDASTSGPILTVSAEGPTPESALQTMNRVLDAMPTTLASLQDELALPQSARIKLLSLAADRKATLAAEARTRAVLVVVALGGAGTLLLTGLMDKMLLRRKVARSAGGHRKKVRSSLRETRLSTHGALSIDAKPEESRVPVSVPDDRA